MSSVAAVAKLQATAKPVPRRWLIVRDSLWMTAIGQVERCVGLLVTFSLRWGLSPVELGIYSGLRLLLDNTNRSSLGVALGAIQKAPVLRAAGQSAEADHVLNAASAANTITSSAYGLMLVAWGGWLTSRHDYKWGLGLILVGLMAVMKRRQDFHVATLRSESQFVLVGRLALVQSLVFALAGLVGVWLAGYWGLMAALLLSFVVQGAWLARIDPKRRFQQVWDGPLVLNLAATGLPILAASSSWAMLNTLDRALILTHMPDGAAQAGFYSLAILATNWCGDVAGRVALVLYPSYQKELGQGRCLSSILAEAESAALLLLAILTGLSLWAYLAGQWLLPLCFPKLAPGLAALGPMLPGAVALGATWPLRQAWTAINRPWPLATLAGVVALLQYFVVRHLAGTGTIADVALASSVFQVIATALLFGMNWVVIGWNRRRILQMFLTIVSVVYWFALAWLIFTPTFLVNGSGRFTPIVELTIGTAPIVFLAFGCYFYKIRKNHDMENQGA